MFHITEKENNKIVITNILGKFNEFCLEEKSECNKKKRLSNHVYCK
jgi:hypothetical protein